MRTEASAGMALLLAGLACVAAEAPRSSDEVAYAAATARQTEADEYTRYELLEPDSASFRIDYEVTATTPGATAFYNPIRKGSEASDESVVDAHRGLPLKFEIVSGAQARKDPLMADADADMNYIRVALARPVPEHGQARILIRKTYRDAQSYFRDGATIVFKRPLGVRRNKVVLPEGYSIVGLSVPSQVRTEPDGRLAISFLHAGAGEAPLELRAVKDAQVGAAARPHAPTAQRSWESPFEGPTEQERLAERAHEDREIVYFLQQPETHAFKLYHDYTEDRPGISGYANVVRTGSVASNPSATALDTGEALPVREMSGAELNASSINVGERVDPAARVVVIAFSAVRKGESLRLRIAETYMAPTSYRLDGDDLVFDRSFGRPRNAVVLPTGWYCTFSSAPATVGQLPDGRIWLDYWDDRPEAVDVLLKARRRAAHR